MRLLYIGFLIILHKENITKIKNIKNQNIKNQNIKNKNIKNQNIKNQNIKNQNIKNKNIKNQNIKNQNIKNQNITKIKNIKNQNIKNQNIKNKNNIIFIMDLSNILINKTELKRERKHNAIKLPESLDQSMIPKYVGYYKECYNYEKKLYREFFKIEKHPLQNKNKVYISSKSNKLTILEKLEQIKKILKDLNNNGEKIENIEENNEENNGEKIENKIKLPKYISLKNHEKDINKYYIIYDKKTNTNRISLKAIFNKLEPFSQNLELFLEKIENKLNNN